MNNLTLVFGTEDNKKKNFIIRQCKDEIEANEVKALMKKMIEKKFVKGKGGEDITKIISAKNVKTEVEEIQMEL